jgi:hypothetical protein
MAQHSNYWSCSPFADWLRGTKKLSAGTSEEWDEWTTAAQVKHNFRYWLAEEGLSHLQDFVTWPIRKIYAIKYYINNRWVTRTHSLTAHARDIRPGDWCDVGNRFLPCLFNELVDYVEMELAWWHIAWDDEAKKKYQAPFWARGWWRVRTWRCPEAGIDNLNWQAQLRHDEDYCKDESYYGEFTPQAVKAQEILSLYTWWTTIYRNRPDPYDASGWTAYCELSRLANGGRLSFSADKTPELKAAGEQAHEELRRIEAEYEQEDEDMMIRLIKVRHGLWT